jgi:RNA polymerase sigma-70 factor (ECF subfamily)
MRREADGEDEPELSFAMPGTPLDDLDTAERHARVEEAIQRLPEHRRVPLVLYHFEALSYHQIADKLQISLSKVKTDISRARAMLARSLAS